MFGRKKKQDEVFRPQDLAKMGEQQGKRKKSILSVFNIRRAGSAVAASQLVYRASLGVVSAVLLIMGTGFLISSIIVNSGNLTISVNNNIDSDRVISLSSTEDFSDPTTLLNADSVEDMDNITYRWLPGNLDDKEGSHNGKNYIAYTFFLRNAGTKTLNYKGQIDIIGAAKSIDDAVRIMVYENGESTVYAKPRRDDGKPEVDPDVKPVPFKSSAVAMATDKKQLEVGDKDKYTVVVWLEGEDRECVNDVMGGILKMKMSFSVVE